MSEELDVIKKPYSKTAYTTTELDELLRCLEDPVYFTKNFIKVQHPTKGLIPLELYPFQEEMMQAFNDHRFVVALTGRQLGKALALDTPIPTPTGWTTMGQLKIGDYVLGDDGKPALVSFATAPMFNHRVYEIEFDNGEIIKADAEHLWKFGSSTFEDKLMTTEEAIVEFNSGLFVSRKLVDENPMTMFELIDTKFYVKEIREIPSVPVRCIRVENDSHMFLAGKSMIPTHNTTTAGAFLLWKAMFTPDTTILITANTYMQALEIMERIRTSYEKLPNHIRAGATEYNKGTIAFDNGSRIIARATSANAGRGLSISLLYCLSGDTTVTVRDKETGEIMNVSLEELYGLCE